MTLPARSTGQVIVPGPYESGPHGALYESAAPALTDPRAACADALAAYLGRLVFTRWGADAPSTPFQLDRVTQEWPEPSEALLYPSASIVDVEDSALEGHALVPTPLEETYGVFGEGTVLWKVAEMPVTFQVDFWTDDAPTREAVAARLPSAFAPGEDGARIVLTGSSRYWGRTVRASLISYRRQDNAGSSFPRERRLMARVRCEVDVVDLRCATLVQPSLEVLTVDGAPTPEPEAQPASSVENHHGRLRP